MKLAEYSFRVLQVTNVSSVSETFPHSGVHTMPKQTLEKRLSKLEQQVAILIGSQKPVGKKVAGSNGRQRQPLVSRGKWQQTLGVFGPEDGMDEVFDEALKLRELDRKQTGISTPSKKSPAKPSRTRKLVRS
jgi:hypothetical protein